MINKLMLLVIMGTTAGAASANGSGQPAPTFVLDADSFRHHVDFFNTMEPENIVNYISNDKSWPWMSQNIPFFECPDEDFERIYYFRWWTFRKHLKQTPDGFVFTDGRKVAGSDDLTRVTGELQ